MYNLNLCVLHLWLSSCEDFVLWPIVICTKYVSNEKIVKMHQAACGTQIGLDCGKPAPLAHRNSGPLQKWHVLLHALCCIWTQIVPMPCLMLRGCSKISASWICSSWISNKLCCQRAPSCYTESKNFSIRRCLCGSCSSAFANFNLKLFQWYILSFLKNCSNVGCFKKNCDHKALTNWRDSWDPNYWFVQK